MSDEAKSNMDRILEGENVKYLEGNRHPKKETLSPRHKMFADEYLRCYSPTKAARKAGYSETSIASIGYQLIRRDDISEYVNRHMENREKMMHTVPFDVIVADLTEIALDPDRDSREKMKAADLLMKWNGANKWTQKENAEVDKFVEALKDSGDTWEEE